MNSEDENSIIEEAKPKKNIESHILSCIKGVSVEPVLFLYNIAVQVIWIASQDLMIDKACKVNFNYDEEICNNLNQHKDHQEEIQDLVSKLSMYRAILETSIMVIFTLFTGSWSDKWGRKAPLLICLTCMMLESVMYLVNCLMTSWRMEYILIASAAYSLGGKRTMRLAILEAAYCLGGPVGYAIVSPILHTWGFKGAFGFNITIFVVLIIYVTIWIRSVQQDQEEMEVSSVCDLSNLTESVVETLKPRPDRGTFHILLLMLASVVNTALTSGEFGLVYYFTNLALDWTNIQYSHWAILVNMLTTLNTMVVIPLLSLVVGLSDGWMGVIGAVSKTATCIMQGFISKPSDAWLMWTGGVVGSLKIFVPVAVRSRISKLAGSKDVGKVYAVLAVLDGLIQFPFIPLYTAIYTTTNDTYPGTFNFLSAGLGTLTGLLLLFVELSIIRISKKTASTERENLPVEEEVPSPD